MAEKQKKAPGIFRKPVKKEKWEKKFLKKIYLPEDRKFIESLAVEEDGFIRINVDGLSKKDKKRLKVLGKAIKKNRKGVNFILILILLILAGGILFFQFYLKDKLVQRLVETQLEKIFQAEVETRGVNLSIFDGHLSLSYLAIADAYKPMTNLIEFSSVEADLKTSELLQGRVFIEKIGFTGMKRGTERETSGKLVLDAEEDKSTEAETPLAAGDDNSGIKDALGDVINQISAMVGDFDVEELLEQQKDNLKSFGVIEDSRSSVDTSIDKWKGRVDEWSGKLEGWESSVNYIGTVNPDSFSSLESAQSTITNLRTIYNDADRDYNEIKADYASAERQYNETLLMVDQVKAAVAADYDYIESIVTLPAGEKVDWAASILEQQLSVPFTKYLSYLERGLLWYDRFKRFSDSKKSEKEARWRYSRSLPPPSDAPPKFTLAHAFASGEEPDLKYQFDLYNIVSEPEKWDEEVSLELGLDTPSTGAAAAVITEDSLSLDLPGAPFDLGDSLSSLDIASISGRLGLISGIAWNDTGFLGSINLNAAELILRETKADSILYRLISTSLESVDPLSAEGSFTWSEAEGLGLSIETELDDSLGDAAKALAAEGAEEGLKLLKDYLGEQLEGPLADFELSREDLEGYVDQIKNYESEIDKYRDMADDKIAEIEKTVKNKLKAQAEDALKNLIPTDNKQLDGAADVLKDLGTKLKF